ncbi:SAF domain-containing protein [Haloechinothrix salitolerans]|uniref:SAF domain-containing protein n=1 Tax=Haloechinothrix salitolerans TaxID=926830 RepID=A0ABW2BVS8_9PSEU
MIGTRWLSALRHPRDWLRRRPITLSRHYATARKVVATALLATGALLAFAPDGRDAAHASPVVVTARDVATGTTLRAADLTVTRLPPSAVPTGALTTTDAAIGAMLAGSARTGEPLTDARIVDDGTTSLVGGDVDTAAADRDVDDAKSDEGTVPEASGEPADTATVPVRLSDAAITGLLRPGTRVDVITADDTSDEGHVLATDAPVVTVTAPDTSHGTSATAAPLVLIELPAETATQVAAASLRQPVTITLR